MPSGRRGSITIDARSIGSSPVLPFDASAHAADIRASPASTGQSIGTYDLQIAGHARSRGPIAVAGSRREFDRGDGLRCEDRLPEDR